MRKELERNNARYFVPSYFLTYTISKIICKGFAPNGVLHTTAKIKKCSYHFSSNKLIIKIITYYQDQDH